MSTGMRAAFTALAAILTAVFKIMATGGVKGVVAENLMLKQQLLVVARSRKRAPHLTAWDRIFLGLWSLLLNPARLTKVAVVIRPSTLLRFHRLLSKRKYRDLFTPKKRSKPGPKGPSEELVHAIVELKRRNPRFGCPRIAMIISKAFGVEIDKDVVRRVLAKRYRPDSGGSGPSWLTFLGQAKDSLWSVDLFRCESILLKTHWVLVVMDQFTRRIIGFGVQAGKVDGAALCRMLNEVIAGKEVPERLSSDNDPLFLSHRWKANLRVLDVEEIKSVPYVPLSHPFVERLIGSIRREYLDHVMFWNQLGLERKLAAFKAYFNAERVHQSLEGRTPAEVAGGKPASPAQLGNFEWQSTCSGLVQLPKAA